jgi:hypothetical protein
MMCFEMPYAAKSSELTPAIPRRGLAIPLNVTVRTGGEGREGGRGDLCRVPVRPVCTRSAPEYP